MYSPPPPFGFIAGPPSQISYPRSQIRPLTGHLLPNLDFQHPRVYLTQHPQQSHLFSSNVEILTFIHPRLMLSTCAT
ncbi:hypothetical protein PISMIDRAFT_683651 [Pisolithus microcarpus 441]|uniref:Uncharacterized protein n=1 Tax=Pisolithus microcarpus 441 TaxID=765257 RepID=A0A0C9YQV8_9AGAM|nr:hypothetical protein PISMIDRAFT_683651 [Pisolithus microcarpus 441]